MIYINDNISIDEREIYEDFIHASGPGGQNVNKVSTAVQLRFHVLDSPSLTDDVRSRLIRIAGKRISQEGFLIIEARRFRTQNRNRLDALERLIALIRRAAEPPKKRYPTKPTRSSKMHRMDEKRRRGETKRLRHIACLPED
ncbi:Peptidyl-tRNA hydrolase ArfB [uncultured Desulfobacterium sp.]|uniref:Peptidyl-tRNA hydrolase ArfB n=1 Tax=uncultured Desulfobacterium sp. TaxID=201089 RepID=A0A445MWI3_9BACT|nr:Peptidyl-tRNA hydrolase ArfB [uncultured Desulfobacterium sp.]